MWTECKEYDQIVLFKELPFSSDGGSREPCGYSGEELFRQRELLVWLNRTRARRLVGVKSEVTEGLLELALQITDFSSQGHRAVKDFGQK